MEHLQKIPYIFSILFPTLLFFALGLGLAWWIWYNNVKRLRAALNENRQLNDHIAQIGQNDLSLGNQFHSQFTAKKKQWRYEIDTKNQELDSASSTIMGLRSNEKNLTAKLGEETQRFGNLDLLFGNFKKEKEGEINGLLNTRNTLQADLDKHGKKVIDLEDSLNNRQTEFDQLKGDYDKSQLTINGLTSKIDGIEGDLNQKNSENGTLQKRIAELEGQLSEKESEVGSVNSDLGLKVAALGLLQTQLHKDGEIGDKQNTIHNKDKELEELRAQIGHKDGEIGDKQNTINGKDSEIEELKAQIGHKDGEIGDKQNTINGKDNEIEELKAQLDSKNDEVINVSNDLRIANADLDSATTNLDSAQSDLDSANSDLESKNNQLGEKDDSIDKKDTEIEELKSKLNAKESELGEQTQALGLLQSNLKEAEAKAADNSALEAAAADLKNEQNSHGQTKNKLASIEGQLSKANSALEDEKSKAAAPISAATFFANTTASQNQRHGFLFKERPDKVDKLTNIKGVGEVLEPKLNEFGVYQYKQIALWSQDNIDAFSEDLDFPGRVEREQWVNQAADLHRENHGEHLAPIINIYHPAKTRTIVKETGPSLEDFDGDDVKADEKLGILYNKRPDTVDDLKRIKGVANVLEGKLNDYGVYRYKQVALWNKNNIDEFSEALAFPDRIERDQWIAQALDFHNESYEERLAPRYTVYHDVPAPKPAPKKEDSIPAEFAGESVKEDKDLGVIFTSKPKEVDDLKLIKGVANVLEGKLNDFGIYRFKQVANWNKSQIAEFSERLSFPDRIERDEWKKQAAKFHKDKYNS